MLIRFLSTVLLAASALLTTGCHPYYFTDDIDVDLTFEPFEDPTDLHSPYVLGTHVSISAHREGKNNDGDLRLVSETPRVLQCPSENANGNHTDCFAASAGTATIAIVDEDGDVKRRTRVEVRVPTRIEVYARGPLILGHEEQDARVTSITVLRDGTATFLVRYFDGDEELGGNAVLHTFNDVDLNPNIEQTFWFENREWLQVTPDRLGNFTLGLGLTERPITELPIRVVDADAISDIEFATEVHPRTKEGALRTMYVQANDMDGQSIYGVEYTWSLDGVEEEGEGDLYRYNYAPGHERQVEASFGDHQASGIIETDGGFVSSTNKLGCSVGYGKRSATTLAAFVMAAALLMRRRRRA